MSTYGGPASFFLLNPAGLSNAIRQIWADYVLWTSALINAVLYGVMDPDAVLKKMKDITGVFSALIEQFYGKESAERVKTNFSQYAVYLLRMIEAYRDNDLSAVTDLRQDMYGLADDFSLLLSKANPNWDRATLQVALYEMINSTEQEIVYKLAQDYARCIDAHDQLMDQAYRLSDELAYGLQRQFRL